MKRVDGYQHAWRLYEAGNPSVLATLSVEEFGGNFMVDNPQRTSFDYIKFAISPADCLDMEKAVGELTPEIPPLDKVVDKNVAEAERKSREYDFIFTPKEPGAPMVHSIRELEDNNWQLVGGNLDITDKPVGSVAWMRSPEQLVVTINEVNALIFRPEPFKLFAHIAANKPEFATKKSIWDRTTE